MEPKKNTRSSNEIHARRMPKRSQVVSLKQAHAAAVMIEGILRKTIESGPAIEALANGHPRKLLRLGLQGLIHALDAQEKK
jgi:hypothetical protein